MGMARRSPQLYVSISLARMTFAEPLFDVVVVGMVGSRKRRNANLDNLYCDVLQSWDMIASFSSRALKQFWERGDESRLPAQSVTKIGMVLDALDAATRPRDVDLPGFGFHALKGDRRGQYAVTITRNWRITFRWLGEDAIDVGFEDYHGG